MSKIILFNKSIKYLIKGEIINFCGARFELLEPVQYVSLYDGLNWFKINVKYISEGSTPESKCFENYGVFSGTENRFFDVER